MDNKRWLTPLESLTRVSGTILKLRVSIDIKMMIDTPGITDQSLRYNFKVKS